jgi:hypothetical protein
LRECSSRRGQPRLDDAALGVVDASREKRDSLPARIEKLMELRAAEPDEHRLIWHDLEAERAAIGLFVGCPPTGAQINARS